MMDKKRFIQEYKKLKQEAAPDLWGRIEGGLRSHPERPTGGEGMGMEKKPGKPVFWQGCHAGVGNCGPANYGAE